MSDLIKIIDERETRKTNKQTRTTTRTTTTKKKRHKITRRDRSYSEMVRAKSFCCTFKLGVLQSICKASLIF